MSTETERALVPITITGWRVWDLFTGRDLEPEALTRGVQVVLDRGGLVAPETERQVTASELDMILELFGDHALVIHFSTQADENRVPVLLEQFLKRYPALKGRTIQLNNQLRPNTCEALLSIKAKHELRVILPHYSMFGADAWAASVKLADQVVFDAGGGRGIAALNLDTRTVDALRLITDASKAPIGLAGRLTHELVGELALKLREARATLKRPIALCGDAPVKKDLGLDLDRCKKFYDACVHALAS